MDTVDPKEHLALLPTFTQPPPPAPSPTPPPDPETGRLYVPDPTRDPDRNRSRGSGIRKPDPAATPTETSSDGDVHKATPAEAAALIAGLVGLVVAAGAWWVSRRSNGSRKLREPTRTQGNDIAAPLGRILIRHADLAWLGPDIADGIKAMAATGAYVNDGPLLLSTTPDAGIPANLQEEL